MTVHSSACRVLAFGGLFWGVGVFFPFLLPCWLAGCLVGDYVLWRLLEYSNLGVMPYARGGMS